MPRATAIRQGGLGRCLYFQSFGSLRAPAGCPRYETAVMQSSVPKYAPPAYPARWHKPSPTLMISAVSYTHLTLPTILLV
eukprot:2095472-Amphidinium_carterae.1